MNMSKENTQPVSSLYDFQVWLQCSRYHYYLLIWDCLSSYDVHILNLIETMFSFNTAKLTCTLPNLPVGKSSADRSMIHPKLWKLSADGKSPHQEIRRNSALCTVEALPVSFVQCKFKFFNKVIYLIWRS